MFGFFSGMPKETGACRCRRTSERRRQRGRGWRANPVRPVRLSDSQGELETQKRHHEAKLITTKEEEKHKMDKMALELELKWTETLRWAGVGRVRHGK